MDAIVMCAHQAPGLELLLLFGSRARRDTHSRSDWDFGYLATGDFDATRLLGSVVEVVGSDRIDLVDLGRASGLLRYQAARDGQLVYEAGPRVAEQFRLDAAQFWCDAAPILRRGYDEVLAELKP
jgi:hypothetical protein